jgi:hypothetical protein
MQLLCGRTSSPKRALTRSGQLFFAFGVALLAFVVSRSEASDAGRFEIANRTYSVASEHIARTRPTHLVYSLLGIRLWDDSLDVIRMRLGATGILDRGESGPVRKCYISKDGSNVVVFFADSGGAWRQVTGYRLSTPKQARVDIAKCHSIGADAREFQLGGLRIGATRAAVRQKLGSPSATQEGSELRVFEYREKLSEPKLSKLAESFPILKKRPYLQVTIMLEATYCDSVLASLELHIVKEVPDEKH